MTPNKQLQRTVIRHRAGQHLARPLNCGVRRLDPMSRKSLVEYWNAQAHSTVGWCHPEDASMFATRRHSFNLDFPVSPYVGDVLQARVLILGANAGGWGIPIENPAFSLWVGCGNYEKHADSFLCFIEPRKPYVRKFLRKIDSSAKVEEVAVALDAALTSHPRVRDVRWWSESEAGI